MRAFCSKLHFPARSIRSNSRSFSMANSVSLNLNKDGEQCWTNWSLVLDGVTPENGALRNANHKILVSKMKSKSLNGKIECAELKFTGKYTLQEAGDSVTHEQFREALEKTANTLSGSELYVEDGAIVAATEGRIGARIVTPCPATALAVRNLLIRTPPRPVNHMARYNGWRLEKRWGQNYHIWNGSAVELSEDPVDPGSGERPIVLYYGGEGDKALVQFIENKGLVVGSNCLVGKDAPITAVIDALTLSAEVVGNSAGAVNHDGVVLGSTVLASPNSERSILVVGPSSSEQWLALHQVAAQKGCLYGGYAHLWQPSGVSSAFEGAILPTSVAPPVAEGEEMLMAGQLTAVDLNPNNRTWTPSEIVFWTSGASSKALDESEVVKRLAGRLQWTEESEPSQMEVLKGLVKSVGKFSEVSSVEEMVNKALKA